MFPLKLCRAILSGVRNQLRADRRWTMGQVGVQHIIDDERGPDDKDDGFMKVGGQKMYSDDITGQVLHPTLAQQARQTELDYFASKQVWEIVSVAKAINDTGRKPIRVRWVDVNKGATSPPTFVPAWSPVRYATLDANRCSHRHHRWSR